METAMAILVGILFAIGTYLMLSNSLMRLILGTSVISHAVNLLIIIMGGVKTGAPPLLGGIHTSYTDPLPQALILTAIVINFAVTAFFLVIAYRTYEITQTDDLDILRRFKDE